LILTLTINLYWVLWKDICKRLLGESISDKQASQVFGMLDKDESGKVTEQEFLEWWREDDLEVLPHDPEPLL